MKTKTRSSEKWTRRIAVAATSLLLAVALLSGLFRAGGRYFYCEAMGMMLTDPCAAVADEHGSAPANELREASHDCCIVGTLPAMPDGSASSYVRIESAPLLAVVPAASFSAPPNRAVVAANGCARGAPPGVPRPPSELRAKLMVFLT